MVETCRARPFWVWMDTAATCNLSCKLCYTTAMQSASIMNIAVFSTVLDRFQATEARLVKFHLNWRGEPTSNPRLAKMLRMLTEMPWEVEWHTNGTLLHPRRAAELVEANPRQTIYVSLDGGTAHSFESNRGVGTWEKALQGAEALLAARGSMPFPRIGIYQLDLGLAPDEYDPRFRSLVERVDSHIVMTPVDTDGGSLRSASTNRSIPTGPCFWLGNALAVDVTGVAWTCLLGSGTRLGTLITESVDDLLDLAGHLRQRVSLGGRSTIDGCATCRKKEGGPLADGGDVRASS